MTAEAKILNNSAEDVLIIPMKTLQFNEDDEIYVFIKDDKNLPIEQFVKVGINDGRNAQITEGLEDGQVVMYKKASTTEKSGLGGNIRPSVRSKQEELNMEILNMKNIVKSYEMGEGEQVVLKDVSLTIDKGEFISILGPSGSGKTTFMNIIGCLDVQTEGKYILNNNEVGDWDEAELAQIRNKEIGFVFQQFQLLPRLTALQNVELPLVYAAIPSKQRKQKLKIC